MADASNNKQQQKQEPQAKPQLPTKANASKAGSSQQYSSLQVGVDAAARPGLVLAPQYPANLIKADPTKEYVAGGDRHDWLLGYAKTLPVYIDDLTSTFGPKLYETMMNDSVVSANVEDIKLSVLASGVTLTSRIENEEDPKYTQSEEITEFHRRNLDNLKFRRGKQSFLAILNELLDGVSLGHKVAEKVYYYNDEEGDPDRGRLCLDAIKVKDNEAVGFVMDAFNNLIGIQGVVPGQGATNLMPGLVALPVDGQEADAELPPPNIFPPEKFIIFTFRSRNGDPRGRSILRSAYDPWWCKNQVKAEFLKYLAQYAVAGIVGTTADQALDIQARDENGALMLNDNGDIIMLTPVQAMMQALEGYKNGGIIAVPFGSEVNLLEATGDGQVFELAFNFYNKEIEKGITGQTLATSEGQHQARAAAQTHENTLEKVILSIKNTLVECIKDILYWLTLYNFGKEAADLLTPAVSLAEAANSDFAENLTAVAAAQTSGYLHTSQYPALDAQIGLPPRDMDQFLADQAAAQEMQQKALEAKAKQPVVGPGESQQKEPAAKQNPSNPSKSKDENA